MVGMVIRRDWSPGRRVRTIESLRIRVKPSNVGEHVFRMLQRGLPIKVHGTLAMDTVINMQKLLKESNLTVPLIKLLPMEGSLYVRGTIIPELR